MEEILIFNMDKNKNIQLMAICHEHGKSKDGLYTIYTIDIFFLSCHHHLLHGSCVVCKVMGLLLLIFVQGCQDKFAQEGSDFPLMSQCHALGF